MSAARPEPLVRFIDVSKSYDGKVDAVRALNLEVEAGEFLTLLGPSGSGKTTTLTMLAGFEQPTSGRIFVGGEDVTGVPVEKRGIGMVFQNYALFPNMSVAENIAFPLTVRRLPRAEIAQKVARALSMVRLEGLADRRTQQLSGGQQQRVAVARALVFEPRLVLLDEPLGALDRQLREQMQYELKHLHRRLGVTMVYVTHDQIEAMTMSDRVAVFSSGKLRQVAEPRRLYEEPDSLFVAQFLGESNALAATVERRDGGQCAATLLGGETIVATAVGACVAGGRVDLVLRPEKVALGTAARACINRFPARVVEATFLGDQVRVRLAALGQEDFVLKLPNAAGQSALEPGATVEIGWRTEDCRALVA
jgi:putative spermidine/putrescine transport system ATP-binding protein